MVVIYVLLLLHRSYFILLYSLALLQDVVDRKCMFWDNDFGWAGRCHDWTFFQNSDKRRK